MNIAAAYIRVSTDDQTEYSPDAQLKLIKEYCSKNEYILGEKYIFVDEGKSGRKAEKRPEFMRMIATAKSKPKPFDVILVHKFDRFARNREDSVVFKSLLNKECGVKVISITESVENDKVSLIMESMLEAMAEYYSLNLAEEVKKGMTEKAYRGEPQTTAPFGYVLNNKRLVINEDEAEIVRKIYDDFINRKSYRSIATEINDLGITTHRGNKWENRTVDYILKNPVYCGYLRWNPTEKTKRKYDHPDLIIAKGNHESIISKEIFDEVQKISDQIKIRYRKYYKPQYKPSHWLIGLLYCPKCNGGLSNSNGYFVCNKYAKGQCDTRNSISVEKLEFMILELLKHDLKNTHNINIQYITPQNYSEKEKELYSKLENLNFRFERVTESYEKGIDTIEEYATNKNRLTKEINETKSQIENLQRPNITHNKEMFQISMLDVVTHLQSDSDMISKHKMAESIIKSIIYNKEENSLSIEYYYLP